MKTPEQMLAEVDMAVAAEREACALEVEEQIAAIERMKQGHPFRGYDAQEHLRYAAKRIRARGKS